MDPEHLLNLLDRRAKTVVYRMWRILPHGLEPYWREDLLTIAKNEVIKKNFLENFRHTGAPNLYMPTLTSYIDQKLKGILINFIRQISGIETLGRTDLGVLARYSRKIAKEGLQRAGYAEEILNKRLVAWKCFREFRQAFPKYTLNFELQQFKEIADLYAVRTGENIDAKTMKEWLHQIAKAVRYLLDGRKISLEQLLEGHNTNELELLNNSKEITEYSDKDNLGEFKSLVRRKLSCFDKDHQKLLLLTYGFGMNQTEVARVLNISQSKVSRQQQKLLKDILKELCIYLKISPITSERLRELNQPLKEYLEYYYQQQCNQEVNKL